MKYLFGVRSLHLFAFFVILAPNQSWAVVWLDMKALVYSAATRVPLSGAYLSIWGGYNGVGISPPTGPRGGAEVKAYVYYDQTVSLCAQKAGFTRVCKPYHVTSSSLNTTFFLSPPSAHVAALHRDSVKSEIPTALQVTTIRQSKSNFPADLSRAYFGQTQLFPPLSNMTLSSPAVLGEAMDSLYQRYLGRSATATELKAGLTSISQNGSLAEVAVSVTSSEEYLEGAGLAWAEISEQ